MITRGNNNIKLLSEIFFSKTRREKTLYNLTATATAAMHIRIYYNARYRIQHEWAYVLLCSINTPYSYRVC